MIQVAFRKSTGGRLSTLLRRISGAHHDHCEIVFERVCMSVAGGVVRHKIIDLRDHAWEVVDMPWVDEAQVYRHWVRTKGTRHGSASNWCAAALGLPRTSTAGLLKMVRAQALQWRMARVAAELKK